MANPKSTIANLSGKQMLDILRNQLSIWPEPPRVGAIGIVALEIGGPRAEALLSVEDAANGGDIRMGVPARFAERLAHEDDEALQQLERVMRAEMN